MSNLREITDYGLKHNKTLKNNDSYSKKEKPISSVYNIYFNKEELSTNSSKIPHPNYSSQSTVKRKVPLYRSPFYSPNKIDSNLNYSILFPKTRKYKHYKNIYSTEKASSSLITSSRRESLYNFHNSTFHSGIYIRKNRIASPKRCLSEKKDKNVFKNKLGHSYLTLTPSKIGEEILIYKSNNNSRSNKKHNIININLYNEKNNFIANNIINKIYINKNKNRNRKNYYINEKKYNNSFNSSSTNNNESVNLTERKTIQRRSNYCLYYNRNNNNLKNKRYIKHNKSKIKINELPKVQRISSKKYNESLIIKIQSVIRGYLLNKKLDKYLRQYIRIKEGIKFIELIYKRKILNLLKHIRKNKNKRNNYCFRNIYYSNKRNNTPTNSNKDKNIELQSKINELINEKMELQNNYESLKEFIRKYKELEKENKEIKNENVKLKLKNNELLTKINLNKQPLFNYNLNKYKRYSIAKQINIDIISPKRVDLIYRKYNLNKEIKKDTKNDFFTLGMGNDDEIEKEENNDALKIYKLKYLFIKKENNIKFILFKYFIKLYYNALYNQNILSIPIGFSNYKTNMNIINKRYNQNYDSSNNLNNVFHYMSIKTLSDNSSVITERRSQNKQNDSKLVASNFYMEDDIKNK